MGKSRQVQNRVDVRLTFAVNPGNRAREETDSERFAHLLGEGRRVATDYTDCADGAEA